MPPADRNRLRTVLGVTPLEDRTVPAAVPAIGPNGGAWVKVDTLTVSTRTNQTATSGVTSNVVLDAGMTYQFVVSGTAKIATDATGDADGEYIRFTKPSGPQDGSSPGYAWNNHGVRIAGVDGGDTTGNLWGAYQDDHQYVKTLVGQGTKVTGYYSDIPGYYGDNSGTLQVDIYAEVPLPVVTVVQQRHAVESPQGGGNGVFLFTRDGGDTTQPLTVSYTIGGTAANGRYVLLSGTVTFAEGSSTAIVEVRVNDDMVSNLGETVVVTVAAKPGYAVGNPASASLTIIDDEPWLVNSVGDFNDASATDARPWDGTGKVTLRAAIQEAKTLTTAGYVGNVRIAFDPAVFGTPQTINLTGKMDTITTPVTITGPGKTSLAIVGSGKAGMFTVGDDIAKSHPLVTISDLTLQGGVNEGDAKVLGHGGAIKNFGQLTLNSVRILDSRANQGGGITTYNKLVMSNCEVRNCDALLVPGGGAGAGGKGGAIEIAGGGSAQLDNCDIRGNKAERGGAIIVFNGMRLQMTDTTLTNNQATDTAGALYNSGGFVSIKGGQFVSNSSANQAGALINEGDMTLDGVTFTDNTAVNTGGAIVATGKTVMKGGVIQGSKAKDGAGVFVSSGNSEFRDGIIIRNNEASGRGGASYSFGGKIEFTEATFVGNAAKVAAPIFAKEAGRPAEVLVNDNCAGASSEDIVEVP